MAGMISTYKTSTLGTILDDANVVLYSPTEIESIGNLPARADFVELPVIEDSIEVDMGSVDASYTKLTDGTVVAGKFSKGDPSCSFNVASIHATINSIFGNRVKNEAGTSDIAPVEVDIDGDGTNKATIAAYSNGMISKVGCIVISNATYTHMVVFPKIKMTANFQPTGGGDANAGYWAVNFIPQPNGEGASFYLG